MLLLLMLLRRRLIARFGSCRRSRLCIFGGLFMVFALCLAAAELRLRLRHILIVCKRLLKTGETRLGSAAGNNSGNSGSSDHRSEMDRTLRLSPLPLRLKSHETRAGKHGQHVDAMKTTRRINYMLEMYCTNRLGCAGSKTQSRIRDSLQNASEPAPRPHTKRETRCKCLSRP